MAWSDGAAAVFAESAVLNVEPPRSMTRRVVPRFRVTAAAPEFETRTLGFQVLPRRKRGGAPLPGTAAICAAETTWKSSAGAFEATTELDPKATVAWRVACTIVPDGMPLEGTCAWKVNRVAPPAGIAAPREGVGGPVMKAPVE